MNREEILKEIRKIVGRSFQFSDTFVKTCPVHIGSGHIKYCRITKKYLYVDCFAAYCFKKNEDGEEEYKLDIRKFPICYNKYDGFFTDKIALEELFTSDLNKILEDIKYVLWWESEVRLPKIKAELTEVEKFEKMYNKLD